VILEMFRADTTRGGHLLTFSPSHLPLEGMSPEGVRSPRNICCGKIPLRMITDRPALVPIKVALMHASHSRPSVIGTK
jgi:hypothetical protein